MRPLGSCSSHIALRAACSSFGLPLGRLLSQYLRAHIPDVLSSSIDTPLLGLLVQLERGFEVVCWARQVSEFVVQGVGLVYLRLSDSLGRATKRGNEVAEVRVEIESRDVSSDSLDSRIAARLKAI
jgi:hypothetical protein